MTLSAEQKAIRARGLGGSDIAAVLGLDPYRTPFDVWMEKVGRAEPFAGNEHTRWGERMEDVIAEAYRERSPFSLQLSPGSTLVHPRHPIVVGTPDRIAWFRPDQPAGWGLEIKNKSPRQAWRWAPEAEGPAGVPDEVQAQVHWYLALTGYEVWDVAAYFGGADMRVYRIHSDPEIEGAMVEAGARFWRDHVLADVPPAFDGGDAAWGYLRERLSSAKGKAIAPTAEIDALACSLEHVMGAIDHAEQRKAELRQRLTDLAAGLGVRGFACDDWRFSAVEQRGRVNYKTAFAAACERAGIGEDARRQIEEGCRGRSFVAPRFTSRRLKESADDE
jgi:putative phage-type endonuclease